MIKRVDNGGQVKLVTNIRKPRKWRRYEYLLNSGTQYINTKIYGYMSHRYEITYQLVDTSTGSSFFWGTRGLSSYVGKNMSLTYADATNIILYWNSLDSGGYSVVIGDFDNSKHALVINEGHVYKDGIDKGISNGHNSDFYILNDIFLFAYHNYPAGAGISKGVKIYEYKDYDASGNLVRHMVPAQYQGQYGMWDLVEDKFYKNAGTGAFTVGPEIKNYEEVDEVRRTSSILPSGVELYDYILSSGTLYIDTGWIIDYTKSFEVTSKYNVSGNRGCILSSYGSARAIALEVGKESRFWLHDGNKNNDITISVGDNHVSTFSYGEGTWKHQVDNETALTGSASYSDSAEASAYMFLDRALRTTRYDEVFKMYYLSIKENGILIRNFLPCTYLGEPGMWDTVENKFYRNQGTGLFILGNKIVLKEYKYLLGDGSAWINTGYTYNSANNTYEVRTKFSLPQSSGLWDAIFSAYTNEQSKCMRIIRGNSDSRMYFYCNTKASGGSGLNLNTSNSNIREVILSNGTISITEEGTTTSYSLNTVDANDTTSTFILYGLKPDSSSNASIISKTVMYYFKLYDNNILVRDYVPVSCNGVYGMWDKIEWKFYGNAGTGSFTLGPEKASGIYPVRRIINIDNLFTFRLTAGGEKLMRDTALLNGIKGNSIAWNLLFNSSVPIYVWSTERSGSYTYSYSENVSTLSYTGTGGLSSYYNLMTRIEDTHKLYITFKIKTTSTIKSFYCRAGGLDRNYNEGNYITPYDLTANTESLVTTILPVKNRESDTKYSYIVFDCNTTNTVLNDGDTITIRDFLIIDLTRIYGENMEPTTTAQFESDYFKWFGKPLVYEPYDAGSIRTVKSTELKSRGFNQWDELWALGIILYETGANGGGPSHIYSPNFIPVIQNSTYYIVNPNTDVTNLKWNRAAFYDKNYSYLGTGIGWKGISGNSTVTIPKDARYMKFYVSSGGTYNNNICINISNANLNREYKSYMTDSINLPITTLTGKLNGTGESIIVFPDGMKKVDSIYDEIKIENGVTKAIKRVGSVDLGTLTWSKFTDTNVFYSPITTNSYYYCLCSKYYKGNLASYTVMKDKTYSFNANYLIRINDTEYSDTTVFKNSLNGVILYYSIEPKEYILDNFTLPQYIKVERGGTEEVISTDSVSVGPTLQLQYTV